MTGYFSSGALRELAASIAHFIKFRTGQIKFLISPCLSPEDSKALERAIDADESLIPLLFPGFDPSEDSLRSQAVEALSYLVATKRISLRIALQASGMFHTKAWIFETEEGRVAIHGSGNATQSGLSVNFEQLTVDVEPNPGHPDEVVEALSARFDAIWANGYPSVRSFGLTHTTIKEMERIQTRLGDGRQVDAKLLSRLAESLSENDEARPAEGLRVPGWLNYRSGDFAHQGEAIKAWRQNGGRGILSIATGGGKTLTALTAAALVQTSQPPLLLVIAAPTTLLVEQWGDEARKFGVEPTLSTAIPSKEMPKTINACVRNLRSKHAVGEVIVLTHDALKHPRIVSSLDAASQKVPMMLVGDEVHNLGSVGFQEAALDKFTYRLGLSATVERQFDQSGTAFLTDYFGPVVFEFPLEKAIGTCLVPFQYYVHRITLTDDERDDWLELTAQIRKLSYAAELADGSSDKERWQRLCLKRRRVIEAADGKVSALAAALPEKSEDVTRTLIFATDKNPAQLEHVNTLLSRRGLRFHQVTQDETQNKARLSRLIGAFSNDQLQVLTSKRVLDEGFNVPQTQVAYLLANSTVKRQWVQRLGRILRKSPETGKTSATIHDFVVMPEIEPGVIDSDLKSLVRSEIARLQFFNGLSVNGLEKNGAMDLIDELLEYMGMA
jgi:superfamily II DNA or RNA helicase